MNGWNYREIAPTKSLCDLLLNNPFGKPRNSLINLRILMRRFFCPKFHRRILRKIVSNSVFVVICRLQAASICNIFIHWFYRSFSNTAVLSVFGQFPRVTYTTIRVRIPRSKITISWYLNKTRVYWSLTVLKINFIRSFFPSVIIGV